MAVREILKMGDARLLRVAQPVTQFDTDELHLLITDMLDTMRAANGAGLAAPQIGVDLQLVIFGSGELNPRYPDAPPVPRTVLVNPEITPLGEAEISDWEGCLSVPGLRAVVPRWARIRYSGFDQYGDPITREVDGCTPCGCVISASLASPRFCFQELTRLKTINSVQPLARNFEWNQSGMTLTLRHLIAPLVAPFTPAPY
jgi:peptide deformylase